MSAIRRILPRTLDAAAITMKGANVEEEYRFNREQLSNLLFGVIGMYREYMDVHEHSESSSRFDAVNEVFEGLDAEWELHAINESRLSMQLPIPPA